MAIIVQDAFYVPPTILLKLQTGEYKRFGSVVRCAVGPNKGQIVKHLKPIKKEVADETQAVAVKGIGLLVKNKKTIAIVGTIAGLATAGVSVFYASSKYEPKVVKQFRFKLKKYIDAISNGTLGLTTINNLMVSLEELKADKNYNKIKIQLTAEELDVIVNNTIKLANDNAIELTSEEQSESSDVIIGLEQYLKTQKRIFESAA